jgi:hypothetical protein
MPAFSGLADDKMSHLSTPDIHPEATTRSKAVLGLIRNVDSYLGGTRFYWDVVVFDRESGLWIYDRGGHTPEEGSKQLIGWCELPDMPPIDVLTRLATK